jgi:hypothetical protein
MPRRRKEPPAEAPDGLDLRAKLDDGPPPPDAKRFNIFLIDTGWNGPVSKAVRHQLPLIYQFQKQDTLYILSHEQSVEIVKRAPELIGHDPTILVYDLFAPRAGDGGIFRGFRLNLGLLRSPEQALARLQEFVRFIAAHRGALHLHHEVRREMHREGVDGMIKILREGFEATIELV